MSRGDALVTLGRRYAALGLADAAAAVLARAERDNGSALAARTLAELSLSAGDGKAARKLAKTVCERSPGAASRLLLGQAQLVDAEYGAARLSFAAVLEHREATPLTRARALVGRSLIAALERDENGAGATAMAALDEFMTFARAPGRTVQEVESALGLWHEIVARAVSADASERAAERLLEAADAPALPLSLLKAALLDARRAGGDRDVDDSDVEAALSAELERHPSSRPARLMLAERLLRRRFRDAAAKERGLSLTRELIEELDADRGSGAGDVTLARAYFLLAAAIDDDPSFAAEAERAYREGLRLQPGHAASANRLALCLLTRGDVAGAADEVERALSVDADKAWTWRNAARVIDATSSGRARTEMAERLLRAALPAAADLGPAAARLAQAAAELSTEKTLVGVHERGHRLKNLLGIAGSRARKARKLADSGDGAVSAALVDLERDFTALWEEWADYLRTMKASAPSLEAVDVTALLTEVADTARERGAATVGLSVSGDISDVRGDRTLLRDALLNIAVNAVEACAGGGDVDISARASSLLGGRAVEICVRDSGPGIPAELADSVMRPGVTNKPSGSGLGLSITARVVSAHHGSVAIDSKPGRGTAVTIVLPTDLAGLVQVSRISGSEELS